MKQRRARRSRFVDVATVAFLAGAIVMAFVDRGFPHTRPSADSSGRRSADIPLPSDPRLITVSRRDAAGTLPGPASRAMRPVEAEPLAELRSRHLELPLQGATRAALYDSFDAPRGSTHSHDAIDILAPRNTPILAVEDGTIARLFESKAGGTTVYQFDSAARYVYYYAHLERYADGLREGRPVRRGQILGYVGTSGNAPKQTPHLHFAIFRLTDKRQWWDGSPIDPYSVLK